MVELSYPALVGLLLLCLLTGRAIQNWCNRTGEAERLAYQAGLQDGKDSKESIV